jgi:hypothetical protein
VVMCSPGRGDVQGRRKWGGVHVIRVQLLCKSSDVGIKPSLYSIQPSKLQDLGVTNNKYSLFICTYVYHPTYDQPLIT